MISVKITKPIYIRKGPGKSHDYLATISPNGTILQMDGWVAGESLKGNCNWYYKVNDNGDKQYYWAGGVGVLEDSASLAPPNSPTVTALPKAAVDGSSFMARVNEFISDGSQTRFHNGSGNQDNWRVSWGHVDLEIWKIWRDKNVTGKGVRIAVFDTGVLTTSNDLNAEGKIDPVNSYYPNDGTAIVTDMDTENNSYHGTRSAGLIAANGSNVNTVYGVAPGAELIIYKVMDTHGGDISDNNFSNMLTRAIRAQAHIISISLELYTQSPTLQTNLEACRKAGIFVVAASGDGNGDENGPVNVIPASLDTVFSVGAYHLDNNQSKYFSAESLYNNKMSFLCPGENVLTTGPSSAPVPHNYTSAATAFAAGTLALALEYARTTGKAFTPDTLQRLLPDACLLDDGTKGRNDKQGYGILYPSKLLSLL